jgi:hypothetical protein
MVIFVEVKKTVPFYSFTTNYFYEEAFNNAHKLLNLRLCWLPSRLGGGGVLFYFLFLSSKDYIILLYIFFF